MATFSRYEALKKLAEDSIVSDAPAGHDWRGNEPYLNASRNKLHAAKFMTNLFLTMLGVGTVGRAAMEVPRLLGGDKLPVEPGELPPNRVYMDPQSSAPALPGPPRKKRLSKFASDSVPPLNPDSSWNHLVNNLGERVGAWQKPIVKMLYNALYNPIGQKHQTLMSGDQGSHSGVFSIPATWAFGIPAAAVAGYGGWAVTDAALEARRKAEKKEEMDDAKSQYEELASRVMGHKNKELAASATSEVYTLFDRLAASAVQSLEKKALVGEIATEFGGPYSAYAVLSALLAGKMAHGFFSKRTDAALTEEAVKRRARERIRNRIPRISVSPQDDVYQDTALS
jgi:hypothetical protein